MSNVKIAAALRLLAEAFETPADAYPEQPAAAPAKRGRGRPVTGEGTPTTPPASSPAATEPDPFAVPEKAAAPTATLDEVRKALTDLKNASSQEKALAVLKTAGGADNLTALTAANYGAVVLAAQIDTAKALAATATKPPVVVEDDPFAMPGETAAPAAKPLTLEDVKAEIVAAQKRTSTDAVQKVVMQNGGKAKNADTGTEGPSLKALPPEKFAETIAALKALPATK